MSAAYDVRATGRVQGVWYRAYVAEQARRQGVTGWVANQPDGSVTGHFEGESAAVLALIETCRIGPPKARVDHLEVTPSGTIGAETFEVRR
ncbi:acylphosphatase [Nocardioides insulae]|uniref:acylphosphatase n=1 Tax=Nocardioides insulae TaxID=394734 RepID=UPI0004289294|nr:acylphosphatase [Nocardioides insulae]